MNRKLPDCAFEYYVGLGITRSYRAVAERFGTSTGAVGLRAMREGWQRRLEQISAQALDASEQRYLTAEAEKVEQHFRASRESQARALLALENCPIRSAIEAVEILDHALLMERALLEGQNQRAEKILNQLLQRVEQRGDGGSAPASSSHGRGAA